MINVAPLRAAARAAAGEVVGVDKAEFEQILAELEQGQQARRELKMLSVIAAPSAGDGYRVGISPIPPLGEPQKSAI